MTEASFRGSRKLNTNLCVQFSGNVIHKTVDSLHTTATPSDCLVTLNKKVEEPCGLKNNESKVRILKYKNVNQKPSLANAILPGRQEERTAITNKRLFGQASYTVKGKVRSKTKQARLNKWESMTQDKNCTINKIEANVTLPSGMAAGKFKMRGKSNSITRCAELCCLDRLCDIAVIMADHCYTVQCFSKKDCESRKTESSDLVIAYMDNRKNESSPVKEAAHEQLSKKTVVPNPSKGNDYFHKRNTHSEL